jgi:hypothetical protein
MRCGEMNNSSPLRASRDRQSHLDREMNCEEEHFVNTGDKLPLPGVCLLELAEKSQWGVSRSRCMAKETTIHTADTNNRGVGLMLFEPFSVYTPRKKMKR